MARVEGRASAASPGADRARLILLAALVLLGLAAFLSRDAVAQAWHWLGWWHWVVLPMLLALVGVCAALLRPPPTRAELDAEALRQLEEARAAVREEAESLRELTPQQFVLQVSRSLRRDGWADAHVDPRDPSGMLVVARRGGASLLVRCHHHPVKRVVALEVAELVGARASYPGAITVIATTTDFAANALVSARDFGVVPMDGEDVSRWMALGPSAWPVTATAGAAAD